MYTMDETELMSFNQCKQSLSDSLHKGRLRKRSFFMGEILEKKCFSGTPSTVRYCLRQIPSIEIILSFKIKKDLDADEKNICAWSGFIGALSHLE